MPGYKPRSPAAPPIPTAVAALHAMQRPQQHRATGASGATRPAAGPSRAALLAALVALVLDAASWTAAEGAAADQHAATSQDHHHHAEPNYQYRYSVASRKTGDVKGAWEKRAGEDVWGAYFLRDPDGYWRTVHYEADGTGFYATVQRRPLTGRGKGKLADPEDLSAGKDNRLEHDDEALQDEAAWEDTLSAAKESSVETNHPALQKGVSLKAASQHTYGGASSDAAYAKTTGEPRRAKPALEMQSSDDRQFAANNAPPPAYYTTSYSTKVLEEPATSYRPPSYSSAYSTFTPRGRDYRGPTSVRPPSHSSGYTTSTSRYEDGPTSYRPPSYSSAYSTSTPRGPDYGGTTSVRPPSYSSAYSSSARPPSRYEGSTTGQPGAHSSTRRPQREHPGDESSSYVSYSQREGSSSDTATNPPPRDDVREHETRSTRPSEERPAASDKYRVVEPQSSRHQDRGNYRDEERGEGRDDEEEEEEGRQEDAEDEGEHQHHHPDDEHEIVPERALQGSQRGHGDGQLVRHQELPSPQALTSQLQYGLTQRGELREAPASISSSMDQLLGPAWAEVADHDELFESSDWPGFGRDAMHAEDSKDVPTYVKKERAAKARRQKPASPKQASKEPKWPWRSQSAPSTTTESARGGQTTPSSGPTTTAPSYGSKVRGKEDDAYPLPVTSAPTPKRGPTGNRSPVQFAGPAHPQLQASTPSVDRRRPPQGYLVAAYGPASLDDAPPAPPQPATSPSYSGWVPLRVPVAASLHVADQARTTGRPSRGRGGGQLQTAYSVGTPNDRSRANVYLKQSWS